MEKQAIHRFYHEHELILTEKVISSKEGSVDCYGCGDPMSDSECAYVCTQQPHCSSRLHKRCAELPGQLFSHPSHPHCILHLFDYRDLPFSCNECGVGVRKLGYQCRRCDVDIHIICADAAGMEELVKEKRVMQHPSHPHPLTLMRKPAFSFTCDACGTHDVDMAYVCSTCEFWLHKACASLPAVLPLNRHRHHHTLSLAFCFPLQHCGFLKLCDVCRGCFEMGYWLYTCVDCRYFVHLHCIDATEFPLHVHDIASKLITPFIMREMPDTAVYMPRQPSFFFERRQRNLGLSLSSEAEENDDLKICDVCVTPISDPPYVGCVIHPNCKLLPKTLSTSSLDSPHLHSYCPITHNKRHKFTLCESPSTCMEGPLYACSLCHNPTNGMVYKCEGCRTRVDVKCASLPTTIQHESHSHHKRLIMTRIPPQGQDGRKECHGCRENISDSYAYCCMSTEACDFALDFKCALLPQSIAKREWDKHPLLLTFDVDASASDCICEICEEEMHPKQWAYHCRHCDYYFHLHCFKTISGGYRNIKFGHQLLLEAIHRHPLTFNCVTLKKRCDICHVALHNCYGLECVSCYYVVCFTCARKLS